ncbi:MAG: hypothetical protein JNM11_10355, partial [Chitinimonas sp.]|nr:hypothetical protein [Chitinimonas sp.]
HIYFLTGCKRQPVIQPAQLKAGTIAVAGELGGEVTIGRLVKTLQTLPGIGSSKGTTQQYQDKAAVHRGAAMTVGFQVWNR